MKNAKLNEEQWKKWLSNDIMSSEDSGPDDNTIVVYPIPWRKEYVTKMFSAIDRYTQHKKTSQARFQGGLLTVHVLPPCHTGLL